MKKNLISVVILALVLVNLVLTAIMMFSVTGTAKKTSNVITQIAGILNLELDAAKAAEEEQGGVSMMDTEFYDIPNEDTVTIRLSADEGETKAHYALVKVTLWINKKSADYETYGASIMNGAYDSAIQAKVIECVSSYTASTASGSDEAMRASILYQIQQMFGSDIVYDVTFKNILIQ